jgi:uncharacterized protein YyaL (SSP411 family)
MRLSSLKTIFILTLLLMSQTEVLGLASKERGDKGEKNMKHKYTNRLINESSPYLLQHAHNPVDWYPWGDEAFERAAREDKPVFLSIGYSTCHWCHVMEVESFDNEQIAKIMNENFVSIKVDREQRPDVDQIYMRAVQIMTGSGGWPLSVFLTADGKPFYGGTYFPPTDRYGRIGFERLLLTIADAWKNRRQELMDSAGKMSQFLAESVGAGEEVKLSADVLTKAFNYSESIFDSTYGGFGAAPKFPQPTGLSMLLGYWQRAGENPALDMVEKTLDEMAKGGIYDHIGGGFHRYSTDARWLTPHFEKMLYDQALISKVYLQAFQITKKKRYAEVVREIFDYVLRDMTDTEGGFYSAEDADSEGREGTFYLWKPEQINSVLSKEEAEIFNTYYDVTKRGNFEENKTILNIAVSMEDLERKFQKKRDETAATLASARLKVFTERQGRIRPHRDDKIITAWNGLMISSLAYGGAVLQERKYILAAERAADFVLENLYKDGRLMRYYRNGKAIQPGFLDDYTFTILGLLDLYEATFDIRWLVKARQLTEEMIGLFADEDKGGFFLTGNDSEKLIARSKPDYDGAIPSGNSAAALGLLRLGRITMNTQFLEQGEKTLKLFSQQLEQNHIYLSMMLTALNFWLGPTQEIVIAGDADAPETKQMLNLVRGAFLPNSVLLLHTQNSESSKLYSTIPFIKNQTAINDKTTAYVCENYVCSQPVNNVEDLRKKLLDTQHTK